MLYKLVLQIFEDGLHLKHRALKVVEIMVYAFNLLLQVNKPLLESIEPAVGLLLETIKPLLKCVKPVVGLLLECVESVVDLLSKGGNSLKHGFDCGFSCQVVAAHNCSFKAERYFKSLP
jgi:hypothetical protein